MRGRYIATLAIVALFSTAACSASGTVKGGSAASPADSSSQDPLQDAASAASSATSAPDLAAKDPCTLVTRNEAQTLIGTGLDPAVEAGQNTDSPSCTYTGPTSGPTAQVEVHAGPGAKKYYDLQRDGLGHAMVAAPGIGDEAWTDKDEMSIFVRKGDAWFAIHLVVLDDPDKFIPRLRDAAKVAVTRA